MMSEDSAPTSSSKAPVDALPVELDYVPEKLKIKARDKLSEDEEKVEQSLKSLKSMLQKEPNLRWQNDDLFLLAFLRVKKFDVNRAFTLIKGFYTVLGHHGDVFYNLNFDHVKQIIKQNILTFLPYRDNEDSVICMCRCDEWDVDSTSAAEQTLCTFLGIIQALHCPATQIAGLQIIFDFKGLGIRHFMQITPSLLKFFFDMIQDGLPVRMRGFYIVNQNYLFSKLWVIIKIFLSKKLRDRVHFHGGDMKSLHEFFHPSILPAYLGGELPPFDNTDWRLRVEGSADYLKHVLSFGYENYLKKHCKNFSVNS